jgi:hypothetical protein
MASAAIQHAPLSGHIQSINPTNRASTPSYRPHDVVTALNYFKDNEDGSPPHATYVNKPETYGRSTLTQTTTIHDIRGSEDKYGLDLTGFQIVVHESLEKEFKDDDEIKKVYYKETENLIKKT